MSSVANRVIKNTGFLYAKMGITMFISLYTTRLILNSLGASDFGIFNIVGGAIAMLGFLNAAMAGATQRFMSYSEGEGDKEKQKSIFNVSFILHLGISFVVGIVLLIAGFFFFNGILNIPPDRVFAAKIVYGSLIVSTMFTVMTVPYDAAMNAHENMKYYAIVGIFESFLKLAVAFACVYTSSDKLIVYGSLMACIPLITLSIMRIYCHKHYEECIIAPRKYWKKDLMKEMTSFAGWNLFQTAVSMITNNGVGIVMNMFFGTVINAAQGIANQICGQLMTLTNNMAKAVNPVITKTEGQKDHNKVLSFASTSSKAAFFITALFSIPAIITMPQLLKVWLKNVPDYAVFFAQCQLIISLCEQLTSGFNVAINASGKIKGISIFKSLVKFSFLPIAYILFKLQISIIIVYCIFVIIQGLINGLFVSIYFLNKTFHYSFSRYLRVTFLPLITTAFVVLIIGILLSNIFDGWYLLFTVFGCCILCNIVLFYFISLNKEEKVVVANLTLKIRKFIHNDKTE
jgi:O-antigen/teichoic acid export membrane protein